MALKFIIVKKGEVFENFHKATYNLPSIKDNVVLKHKSWLKDQDSSISPNQSHPPDGCE